MKKLALCLSATVAAFLSGCQSMNVAQNEPQFAPSSARSYEQVMSYASTLVQNDASLRVVRVSNTGSMRPVLGASSLVLLEQPVISKIHVGDIVTFNDAASGAEKVHRIVALDASGIVTRGDSTRRAERIGFEQLTGHAVAILFFDEATIPSTDRSAQPPMAYASAPGQLATAPALQVLGAEMLSTGGIARVSLRSDGEYDIGLPNGQSLRLFVGPSGVSKDHASSVDINWSDVARGNMSRIQVNDPIHLGAGTMTLNISVL